MSQQEVFSSLIDPKKAAVLRFLIQSPEAVTLKEIAEGSSVPMATSFRLVNDFVKLGLVSKNTWKTSKSYLFIHNTRTGFLKDLLIKEINGAQEFAHLVSEVTEIQQIIVHGEGGQNKANVLVIGHNIPEEPLVAAQENLKRQGFQLSHVSLTPTQYHQMSAMGLYQGKKERIK